MVKKVYTTSNGNPVDDDQNSMTAGKRGPVLLQDFHLIDKLAHFNRERIPERVVHAKGSGAHGYFEVTNEVSHITKAKFLSQIGKRTPVFARFSTVGGEKGSADTARDPRGFAVKFYTEEGNMDMVGNNTPIFFIRDAIKFPDLIHTQKRNPNTNLKDADMFWDFFANTPESTHQVTILFSNRGTPDGYRHMDGFYGHTLKFVNEQGEGHFVKIHFKTDQGIKNLKNDEAVKIAGENPDYAQQDLFEAIEKKDFPSWTVSLQVMKLEDAENYKFDPFDITKVWPHSDYPLQEIGKMVLNRNPDNYYSDTEQAAFAPSNMVPGIEPSPDKMLQGRLFAYADAHRYRLSPNFSQIPINCPYMTQVYNNQRDGLMAVNGNFGKAPNYGPTSFDGPQQLQPLPTGDHPHATTVTANSVYSGPVQPEPVANGESKSNGHGDDKIKASTLPGRYLQPIHDNDFVQAGDLYRIMSPEEQSDLVSNIVGHLRNAKVFIQERMVGHFKRADTEYGRRVEEGLFKLRNQL